MNVIEKAKVFATAAHAAVKQMRKYTGDPYIVHPAEVAAIVDNVPGRTDEMVAAAWLHDTVEDTGVTIEIIETEFGSRVAELVGWLTDISKPEDGTRATRKAIDRAHSASAPGEAQTIKLADLLSNTRSITEYDPSFAKVYIQEKMLLLEAMTRGDRELYARCRRQVERFHDAAPEPTRTKD
jgi:guanosine-3',5'-bis(diphosphate) 3'-pyrophosphohydrolase